jgi:hypothetical protein
MPIVDPVLAAVAVLATASCLQQHDAALVEVAQEDCYTCHRADYERAGTSPSTEVGCLSVTAPIHVGTKPTTCASCHTTEAWCPALDGAHPESAFPIARGAHEMPCLDCHVPELGSSTGGMNVSCIGCHTGEHSMARMNDKHREENDYTWQPDRPAFCRDCHPRGDN